MAALAAAVPLDPAFVIWGEKATIQERRLRHKKCNFCDERYRLRGREALAIALSRERRGSGSWVSNRMLKSLLAAAVGAAAMCLSVAAFAGPAAGPQSEEDKGPPKPLPPLQKNFPLDQTWSLRELNGKPVPDGLDASLKIDGALRGSGFTGCNSWSATLYPVKDQHLAVGPFALTKKQCPKDVMAVEFGFLSSLIGNPTWDLVNGDLVIKGPRGSMRLVRSL